jgi:hypothetical protein
MFAVRSRASPLDSLASSLRFHQLRKLLKIISTGTPLAKVILNLLAPREVHDLAQTIRIFVSHRIEPQNEFTKGRERMN